MKYRETTRLDFIQTSIILALFVMAIVAIFWFTAPDELLIGIFLVLGCLILLVRWHTRTFGYKCLSCGNEFSIPVWKNFISPQGIGKGGGWKLLKCPSCHKWSRAHVMVITWRARKTNFLSVKTKAIPSQRKNRFKKILIGVFITSIIIEATGFVVWKFYPNLLSFRTQPAETTKIKITKSDRLLIIAPHPDDETLGPGALIKQAKDAGADVKVVIVTTGDGYKRAAQANLNVDTPTAADYRALGEIRHKESVSAMKKMGAEDVVFLTYNDGSLNTLWRTSWDYDTLHVGLNGASQSPYSFAYEQSAPYCGENVVKNLSAIIADYDPTIIVYPCPEDLHHDHWATNAFTQYVLAKDKNTGIREYTYLVHRGVLWPSPPAYSPNNVLDPPVQLEEIGATWLRHPNTKTLEDRKLKAVDLYKSQIKLVDMEFFLKAFVRRNELFAMYPILKLKERAKAPDLATVTKLPGVVINDVEATELSQKMGGAGDIRRIAAVYDSQTVNMIVEMKKPLGNDEIMMMNLRIFRPDGVSRMDIRITGGTASLLDRASNCIEPEGGVVLHQSGSRYVVTMSASVFKGATTLMINADVFNKSESEDKWLDRTPWRRINLK